MDNRESHDDVCSDAHARVPPPAKRPRRRWFQFSLRTLLVVMTLVAVWLGITVNRAERQRRVVAAVREAGGEVFYHSSLVPDDPFADPLESPGPDWLRKLIGDDYFDDVSFIRIEHEETPAKVHLDISKLRLPTYSRLSDADLVDIAGCKRLVMLLLPGAKITDDGLRHLSGLRELEVLDLARSEITDAGLAELAQLKELVDLNLGGTTVTDEGLARLMSLTKLERLELFETRITDAGLVHLEKLPNLDTVNVMRTQVTAAGIARLQRARPKLTICSSQPAPTNP